MVLHLHILLTDILHFQNWIYDSVYNMEKCHGKISIYSCESCLIWNQDCSDRLL